MDARTEIPKRKQFFFFLNFFFLIFFLIFLNIFYDFVLGVLDIVYEQDIFTYIGC